MVRLLKVSWCCNHIIEIRFQVKKTQKKREEVIDWWTRLHVTMRDSDSEVAEHSTKCGKSKESSVPKLMVILLQTAKSFYLCFYVELRVVLLPG